jgi:hypothetical protein
MSVGWPSALPTDAQALPDLRVSEFSLITMIAQELE